MPQFDLSVFGPQIVWTALCFAVLVMGMYGVIMPRYWRVHQQRADSVDQQKKVSDAIRHQAEALFRITENALHVTRHEAANIIEHAEKTAKEESQRVRLEEERQGMQQIARARERMAQSGEDMVVHMNNSIPELASFLVDQWSHAQSNGNIATPHDVPPGKSHEQ